MSAVIDYLAGKPLLLLFVVAALGFPLGRLKVGGAPLGNAMVLFVGLAVGALDPRLVLPEIVPLLGLALFVYCIGLASAPGISQALSKDGLRASGLAVAGIVAATIVCYIGVRFLGVPAITGSTMFSGALTNASGLASIVDAAAGRGGDRAQEAALVLGYSLAYPLGVLLPLLALGIVPKLFRVDLKAEAQTIPEFRRASEAIKVATVRVRIEGLTVSEAAERVGAGVTFGRILHPTGSELAVADARLNPGDLVTVVGGAGAIERAAKTLGEVTEEHLEYDRSEFEIRRVFVSRSDVAGRPLRDLNLPQKFGAVVTRVKRGELEFIPDGSTILSLGDRVRVLARHAEHPAVAKELGDSYRALGEADLLPLSIGMLIGLLIGEIPIPLPGGSFRLGFAGGPLVASLILGRLYRTGPIVWGLPYPANLTLRGFGLTIFAAGIGLRAGYGFWSTLQAGRGIEIVLVGASATLACAATIFTLGRYVVRSPLNQLMGVFAGAQTQPVALSFAVARTGNDIPSTTYATVFPIAIIAKIICAQILYLVFNPR